MGLNYTRRDSLCSLVNKVFGISPSGGKWHNFLSYVTKDPDDQQTQKTNVLGTSKKKLRHSVFPENVIENSATKLFIH